MPNDILMKTFIIFSLPNSKILLLQKAEMCVKMASHFLRLIENYGNFIPAQEKYEWSVCNLNDSFFLHCRKIYWNKSVYATYLFHCELRVKSFSCSLTFAQGVETWEGWRWNLWGIMREPVADEELFTFWWNLSRIIKVLFEQVWE